MVVVDLDVLDARQLGLEVEQLGDLVVAEPLIDIDATLHERFRVAASAAAARLQLAVQPGSTDQHVARSDLVAKATQCIVRIDVIGDNDPNGAVAHVQLTVATQNVLVTTEVDCVDAGAIALDDQYSAVIGDLLVENNSHGLQLRKRAEHARRLGRKVTHVLLRLLPKMGYLGGRTVINNNINIIICQYT